MYGFTLLYAELVVFRWETLYTVQYTPTWCEANEKCLAHFDFFHSSQWTGTYVRIHASERTYVCLCYSSCIARFVSHHAGSSDQIILFIIFSCTSTFFEQPLVCSHSAHNTLGMLYVDVVVLKLCQSQSAFSCFDEHMREHSTECNHIFKDSFGVGSRVSHNSVLFVLSNKKHSNKTAGMFVLAAFTPRLWNINCVRNDSRFIWFCFETVLISFNWKIQLKWALPHNRVTILMRTFEIGKLPTATYKMSMSIACAEIRATAPWCACNFKCLCVHSFVPPCAGYLFSAPSL